MSDKSSTGGSLPNIIRNDNDIYQGNLVYYFQVVFRHARNLRHPYHNFRHIMHVLWLCYQACIYYADRVDDLSVDSLSRRQMRNLLIAVLFHDFDHSGMMGDDDLNIARALRALEKYILPEDREYLKDISLIIRATEYPYKVSAIQIGLCGEIIRDADMSQAFSVAWIQQVIFGLATEWNQMPIDLLRKQIDFIQSLKFHTPWANDLFTADVLDQKKAEVHALLDLFELPAAVTPQG